MSLPYNQNEVINELLKVNKNTVIVMSTGSPVDMASFASNAKAVIQTSYNGMEGGKALAEVIFGDINPSGKLPYTVPVKLEDSPAHSIGEFPGGEKVRYDEDVFVGYRYFSSYDIKPLFAFGHGLSYTNFKYDNLKIEVDELEHDANVAVSLELTNIGEVAGAEIVQFYINDEETSVKRPNIELKGFEKIYLEPKETKIVNIKLNKKAFAFYNEATSSWTLESGVFNILVGSSSDRILLKEKTNLSKEYIF